MKRLLAAQTWERVNILEYHAEDSNPTKPTTDVKIHKCRRQKLSQLARQKIV